MSVLRISLLGGVHLTPAASSSESKVTRTVQALLAYLLLLDSMGVKRTRPGRLRRWLDEWKPHGKARS